ncbi:hypothetical protein EV385_3001 [Krasilnikovia cinnamomea]|uniref:TnsA endonuclease-like protein n=1 Tax=Krasilnikovia cinnamomea TaxID=349313 RepID=A0A4Q7ZLK5_9ACTN|nr:TnsA-like heteromeric transposase endonuclease subunit [Krasilnikovia cinnamomea]RZU51195.1 hypothetical protein EV385_3001 [Krasilnikovia cinnamomea]
MSVVVDVCVVMSAPAGAASWMPGPEFSLAYLEGCEGGIRECRVPLAVGWTAPFETVAPVRDFPSYQGQRSFSGSWWAATTREFVGFESWLERDRIMLLDFSPQVTGIASQPFWLIWPTGDRQRRHAPDLFARLSNGTGLVIDVRPDDRIEPKDAEAFAMTAVACEQVGWRYQRLGAVDPVLLANVRWLAGYRHPRCLNLRHADDLRRVFAQPVPLLAAAEEVGDRIAVLPTLFHLLWSGTLVADVETAPLSAATTVTAHWTPR